MVPTTKPSPKQMVMTLQESGAIGDPAVGSYSTSVQRLATTATPVLENGPGALPIVTTNNYSLKSSLLAGGGQVTSIKEISAQSSQHQRAALAKVKRYHSNLRN